MGNDIERHGIYLKKKIFNVNYFVIELVQKYVEIGVLNLNSLKLLVVLNESNVAWLIEI